MSTPDKCAHCGASEMRLGGYACGSTEVEQSRLCCEMAWHNETRKDRQSVFNELTATKLKLASSEAKLADAISDAASWQKQADDRLNDALELGRRAEKAEARVKELEGLEVELTKHPTTGDYVLVTVRIKRDAHKPCKFNLGDAMPRKDGV